MVVKLQGVEYITRKTMLNTSKIEWVERCCNHYVGCSHGCVYPCYARVISRRSSEEWCKPKVVENAVELVEQEIPKLRAKKLHREWILLSSMTDPYQKIERMQNLTQRILRVFIREKMRFRILTKSALIERDYDLLTNARDAQLGFSFCTLDDKQRALWEPGADPIGERMDALMRAHVDYALPTFVSMEPIILGVTKPLEILQALKDYVDFWIFGTHNYAPGNMKHHYLPIREQLIKYCEEHGLYYLIKKELQEVVPKTESYHMSMQDFFQYDTGGKD